VRCPRRSVERRSLRAKWGRLQWIHDFFLKSRKLFWVCIFCFGISNPLYDDPNVGGDLEVDLLRTGCETANVGDQCKIDACKVEQWFLLGYLELIETNFATGYIGVDPDYEAYRRYDINGDQWNFDPTTTCVGTGTATPSDKLCCGYQPFRRIFRTEGGTRACCGSKTYSTALNQCCADDDVQSVSATC
jgi:hypothetical protein